jgi:hypothetical protein
VDLDIVEELVLYNDLVHEFVIINPGAVFFDEVLYRFVESTFQKCDENGPDYLIGNDNS